MKFTSSKVENTTPSRVTLNVSIPWSELEPLRPGAIKTLGSQVKVDGFREGHVPQDMLLKKIPAHHILSEMADSAIQAIYIDLIKEQDITPIGKPTISLKKLAEGNELEFTIETDVLPTITLPKDLEATAKKFLSSEIKVDISDDEVTQALKEIQTMRYQREGQDVPEDLPELDDEFAKTLGKFNSLEEVRTVIKDNLEHEKMHHEIDKRHGEFYDALADAVTADVPQSIVQFEVDKRVSQLEYDAAMGGSTLDEYLKSIEKTREGFIEEMTPVAAKSAKLELIFNEIAAQNNLVPDEKMIEEEVQAAVARYKDSKDFDINRARDYFYTVYKNRMVVHHLDVLGGLPHIHEDDHGHHHHD